MSDRAVAAPDRTGELRLDPGRRERTGIAEAVYAPGKSPRQCADAVAGLLAGGSGPVLLTRADPAQVAAAVDANPGASYPSPPVAGPSAPSSLEFSSVLTRKVDENASDDGDERQQRTVVWREQSSLPGRVLMLTAGTGDLPVAREALAVLSAYGVAASLAADVGVAGIHRVLAQREALDAADLVLVAAGMEGALPSVVAGLTRAPVIAIPTSTGYGSGLDGVTALLAMTASCSPGISVVGIDNGFGAGCAAVRILNAREQA